MDKNKDGGEEKQKKNYKEKEGCLKKEWSTDRKGKEDRYVERRKIHRQNKNSQMRKTEIKKRQTDL